MQYPFCKSHYLVFFPIYRKAMMECWLLWKQQLLSRIVKVVFLLHRMSNESFAFQATAHRNQRGPLACSSFFHVVLQTQQTLVIEFSHKHRRLVFVQFCIFETFNRGVGRCICYIHYFSVPEHKHNMIDICIFSLK